MTVAADIAKDIPTAAASGFISSSIGKKVVVAVTGFVLLGFVIGHMLGNLQVFAGQDQLNKYAKTLQDLGILLWVIRAILAAMLILHVWFAVKLKLENWRARPMKYAANNTVQATLASRTMIWTGLLIFAFVTYHLMHFTFMSTHPEFAELRDSLLRHDVYSMVIYGFRNTVISIFYFLMIFCLVYHLSHGIASMFQTLGLNNTRYEPLLKKMSVSIATLLFLGYVSVPIAVMAGLLKPLPGVNR